MTQDQVRNVLTRVMLAYMLCYCGYTPAALYDRICRKHGYGNIKIFTGKYTVKFICRGNKWILLNPDLKITTKLTLFFQKQKQQLIVKYI